MPIKTLPPWLPYVAPFAVFLLLTTLEGALPKEVYPIAYTVKIVLVTGLLFLFRSLFPEARPGGNGWAIATILGMILCVIWVKLTPHTPPLPFLGDRKAYNPIWEIPETNKRLAFLLIRFFGLVMVVPLMEELFYRGFLLRFVTDMDDFRRVSLGTFSVVALLINVGVFALSHAKSEWLVAAIFALGMCLLLRWTRNLFACILAHGVTNLFLGLYVIGTGQWQYW